MRSGGVEKIGSLDRARRIQIDGETRNRCLVSARAAGTG